MSSLASRELLCPEGQKRGQKVSIQMSSLASREPNRLSLSPRPKSVSIQMSSLASREYISSVKGDGLIPRFHSNEFSSE
ncbi:hypothetical protein GFS31_40910 (plasmid) [Leptolyngbya sp. BL0902]|nr:hypothetical protein GFS31_40910 [Leptolyngbya sp. BL0902]